MSTVTIKRRDTERKISDTLTLDDVAINLTGATVEVAWRLKAGTTVTTQTATVVSAVAGTVEYQFVSGDTDEAGEYWLEWHITFSGGGRLTVPTADKHTLVVVEDLS